MKSHTSEFKEEMKTLGKQQSVRITYTLNNEQIILTNEDINSATPNYKSSLLKSVMKVLELDSNVSIPKGTEIKFEYGLLVNGAYEYLDYGNYIVAKEPEKQEDTLSYKITCYDKMLYSMKDYEHIEVDYPCKIKKFLTELCKKIGLEFKDSTFANQDREFANELFMTINEDGTYSSMGYTYRDVLDQIAETTGGCICMTLDDKVEVRYTNELYNKKSVTGNPIYITDSIENELTINKIKGNNYQETREGYNLLDTSEEKWQQGYFDYTNNTGNYIENNLYRVCQKEKKFYDKQTIITAIIPESFSFRIDGWNQDGTYAGEVKAWYDDSPKKTTFVIQANLYCAITLGSKYNRMNVNPKTLSKYEFLFYEGTEDKPYEPYGESPSPDYPSEIETVGSNVNLYDKDKSSDNFYYNSNGGTTIDGTNKFINQELPLSTSYTISYKNVVNPSLSAYVRIIEYDKNNTFIKRTLLSKNNSTANIDSKTNKVIASVDARTKFLL